MASGGANDAAEYLLHNKKFHDCHLTVGDPATCKVEKIGVVTSHLVAHSDVFRKLLLESELADPTGINTHISDVCPEVFKLMLRHVYGGNLPVMSRETAAQLVTCADKYNIQPLVAIATKLQGKNEFSGKKVYPNKCSNACEFKSDQHDQKFKEQPEYKLSSFFTLKTSGFTRGHGIEIHSLTCKGRRYKGEKELTYNFACKVTVCASKGGFYAGKEVIEVKDQVMYDDNIAIPLKLEDGQFLMLETFSSYNILVEFDTAHPVYKTLDWIDRADSTYVEKTCGCIAVQFKTPLHVRQIDYKY